MGKSFDKLVDWLENSKIDMDLGGGDILPCKEGCKAADCDGCVRWKMLDKVADQVCEEMYQLGRKIAKAWAKS